MSAGERSPDASGESGGAARRIRALLGGPEYRVVFAAVRDRLEEAGVDRARSVTVRGLDAAARAALADLHGWKTVPSSPRVSISLAGLDAALRASAIQASLVDVVEALHGPLEDRRASREAARAARQMRWSQAAAHAVVRARPVLERWLEEVRAMGLLARGAKRAGAGAKRAGPGEDALLALALQAVERLPADGILLPVLASEVAGDAHALDHGQPLASLVLRAAAHLAGWPDVPASAIGRRQLWAAVGVLCDPLSAHVLVLGLRPAGSDALARHLCEWADAGQPRRLTLRELGGSALALEPGADLFVCENPGVVAAAADQLGARAAALVCVEGHPSTAALALLGQLRAGGARVWFHADFDWGGVRIGNLLAERFGALPWRFAAADYRAALADLPEAIPLQGTPVHARWDAALAPAMRDHGRAVFEEQVLAALLADLDAG